eukprot:scaffold84966_cov68-Phaeocystis_antarctica.AAC.8
MAMHAPTMGSIWPDRTPSSAKFEPSRWSVHLEVGRRRVCVCHAHARRCERVACGAGGACAGDACRRACRACRACRAGAPAVFVVVRADLLRARPGADLHLARRRDLLAPLLLLQCEELGAQHRERKLLVLELRALLRACGARQVRDPCGVRRAACGVWRVACGMQRASCAVCRVSCAVRPRIVHHAACVVRRVPCAVRRAACGVAACLRHEEADARRLVGEVDRRLHLVDVLAARAARAGGGEGDVLLLDLDRHLVHLRHHCHGRRARVHAARRLRRRHPLHAMHARLELELGEDRVALHLERGVSVAARLGVRRRRQPHAPPLRLGVLRVESDQVVHKERSLVAARARADLEHDVLLVVGIGRQQQQLHSRVDLLHRRLRLAHLLPRHLPHVGVIAALAEHLLGIGI